MKLCGANEAQRSLRPYDILLGEGFPKGFSDQREEGK